MAVLLTAELLTVGHGNATQVALTDLLRENDVEHLVDIRTQPASRRHPHFSRIAMETWLPIAYRWEPRLGGWRTPRPDSPNVALRDEAMRGYADHMRTPEFWDALDEVLGDARRTRTAVMCSEGDPARCHRSLLADAAVLLRATDVRHLLPGDRPAAAHTPDPRARLDAGGLLTYDEGMLAL
jgi:uncharacterized protein (DUF488 family)